MDLGPGGSDRRALLGLVVLGFALRLLPLGLPFEFSGPDSVGYVAPATSLAQGQGYLDADGATIAGRPPGYPMLLAVIFRVAGGPALGAVRVVQAVLGGLAAALVCGLLAALGETRRVALGGGLLLAVDPIAIGQSPFLLREALLLFLVATLLFVRVRLRGRSRLLLTALLLAVLTLTHQLYVLLGGFLFAFDLWALAGNRQAGRRAAAQSAIRWAAVASVTLLAIVFWARRNQEATGHLSLTATPNAVPARELWLTSECSNAWLSGDPSTGFQARAFAEEARLVEAVGLEEAKAELYRRAWVNWTEHPMRSAGRLLRINLWYWLEVPGAVRLAEHPRLYWLRWLLLPFQWTRLLLAVFAVAVLVRGGRWRAYRAVLAALAFFALAPALLYPVPRYLGPACPLLDLLAALGLNALWLRRAAERA